MSGKIIINHGISTSNTIYELFRVNCHILKPGMRFFPMGVQILKLGINTDYLRDLSGFGLTYMADCFKCCSDEPYSVFLAKEFAAELNLIWELLGTSADSQRDELKKEYLGLFPIVANDQGLGIVSIYLEPCTLDETSGTFIPTCVSITYRILNSGHRQLTNGVLSANWEFA